MVIRICTTDDIMIVIHGDGYALQGTIQTEGMYARDAKMKENV